MHQELLAEADRAVKSMALLKMHWITSLFIKISCNICLCIEKCWFGETGSRCLKCTFSLTTEETLQQPEYRDSPLHIGIQSLVHKSLQIYTCITLFTHTQTRLGLVYPWHHLHSFMAGLQTANLFLWKVLPFLGFGFSFSFSFYCRKIQVVK